MRFRSPEQSVCLQKTLCLLIWMLQSWITPLSLHPHCLGLCCSIKDVIRDVLIVSKKSRRQTKISANWQKNCFACFLFGFLESSKWGVFCCHHSGSLCLNNLTFIATIGSSFAFCALLPRSCCFFGFIFSAVFVSKLGLQFPLKSVRFAHQPAGYCQFPGSGFCFDLPNIRILFALFHFSTVHLIFIAII